MYSIRIFIQIPFLRQILWLCLFFPSLLKSSLRLIFKSSAVMPIKCSLNSLERHLLKECSDCIWWVYVPLTVSVPHWMCQVFNWGLVLISELILSRSTSMLTAGGLNWQCKGRKKSVRKLPLYYRISLIELTDYTVKRALGNWQHL